MATLSTTSGRKQRTHTLEPLLLITRICSVRLLLHEQQAYFLTFSSIATDLYGPQGPTLLSNGPTTVEVQGRWISDVIRYCERNGVKYINPTQEAQAEWKKKINHLSDISLFPTVKSTYMGGSKPDKAFEQTNYAGGKNCSYRVLRHLLT